MKRGQKASSVQKMIQDLMKAPKPDLRNRKRRETEKETVNNQPDKPTDGDQVS